MPAISSAAIDQQKLNKRTSIYIWYSGGTSRRQINNFLLNLFQGQASNKQASKYVVQASLNNNIILYTIIILFYIRRLRTYEGILIFIGCDTFFLHINAYIIKNVKTLSLRSTQSLQWANSIKIPLMFT